MEKPSANLFIFSMFIIPQLARLDPANHFTLTFTLKELNIHSVGGLETNPRQLLLVQVPSS